MDICSEIEWYKGKSNFLTALHIIFVYLASLLYFIPFYEVHVSVCVSFHDLCQNLNITTPSITMYPNTTALCGCNVDQSLLSTFLYFFIISFPLVAQLAWPEATSIIDVGANKGKKILIYCFLLRCTELESNHPAVFMSCLAPNYFSPSD